MTAQQLDQEPGQHRSILRLVSISGGDPAREPGLDAYAAYLLEQRNLAPSTVSRQVGFARSLWADWGTWDVPASAVTDVLERVSGSSRSCYRSNLRVLFAWLRESGTVDTSAADEVLRRRHDPPAPESLLEEYREFLEQQCVSAGTIGPRMQVYRARWAAWGTWDVSAETVQEWLDQYDNAGTRLIYGKYLRALFGWLSATNAIAVDPMADTRPPEPPQLRPGSGLDQYEEFMVGRGLSANTVEQRLSFARTRWNDWGTWEVSSTQIATWLNGFGPWTKSTYFAHLVSLYDWLEKAGGDVAANPMTNMRRPPTPNARPKPLAEEELRRALTTAAPDVRAMLMLGYLAGLRAHEIAKFRGEDINEETLYVLGKGGRAYTLPTHPLLWELAQSFPREGLWFPCPFAARKHLPITAMTVTNKVSRHFRAQGLSGAMHRARHTYGTQLLRGGANLRVVQELMRHSSLATTARYLGVEEAEKLAAIRTLGGRLWASPQLGGSMTHHRDAGD